MQYWAAGQPENAAMAYRRSLAADESGFPGTYLALARLYDQELNKRDSTVVWLLACVEKCRNTKEAKKAADILVNQLNISIPE